jgi:two-component system, cell cycle response regulator
LSHLNYHHFLGAKGISVLRNTILEKTSEAILLVDEDGVARFGNHAAAELFGRPLTEIIGVSLGFPINLNQPTEIDIMRPEGQQLIIAELRAQEIVGSEVKLHLLTLRNITALLELQALSLMDELTGLYNRRAFLAFAGQQLLLAKRNKKSMLMFFVDIDGMKWVNDHLGHPEGDQLLMDSAQALRMTFRVSDIVARLGGDEFAVLAHAVVTDDLRPLTLNHYADPLTNLIGCFVLPKSGSKGIVDHTKTEK